MTNVGNYSSRDRLSAISEMNRILWGGGMPGSSKYQVKPTWMEPGVKIQDYLDKLRSAWGGAGTGRPMTRGEREGYLNWADVYKPIIGNIPDVGDLYWATLENLITPAIGLPAMRNPLAWAPSGYGGRTSYY